MITPLQFMEKYRDITVEIEVDDSAKQMCTVVPVKVKLKKYFLMNWTPGSTQATEYAAVTSGSSKDAWFRKYKESIRTAAMGKGSPEELCFCAPVGSLFEPHKQPLTNSRPTLF